MLIKGQIVMRLHMLSRDTVCNTSGCREIASWLFIIIFQFFFVLSFMEMRFTQLIYTQRHKNVCLFFSKVYIYFFIFLDISKGAFYVKKKKRKLALLKIQFSDKIFSDFSPQIMIINNNGNKGNENNLLRCHVFLLFLSFSDFRFSLFLYAMIMTS